MNPTKTSYIDTFAADYLPEPRLLPDRGYFGAEAPDYPPDLNCAGCLLDSAIADGDGGRVLFHTEQGAVTYRSTWETANRIAHTLIDEFGLQPGNRVLLRGPNTPEMAACWFAVLKAGGICVTTMPLLRAGELVEIAEKARVDFALCDTRWSRDLQSARDNTNRLRHVLCFHGEGDRDLLRIAADKPVEFSNWATYADDIAIIAFTSGTSGPSKAAMHTHRDLLAFCDGFPPARLEASSEDRFCGTPPFGFTYGLGAMLLFPMRARASVALLEQPSPSALLEVIAKFQATICFTTPFVYRAMLETVAAYDVASLRKCVASGEHLSQDCFDRWRQATGLRILDGFGSTELLQICIASHDDDTHSNSGGKPLPGYEARVVDPMGQPVPVGTIGLLAVRGPTGCRYLNDPMRQQEYVKNGWNLTGDLYLQDEAGNLRYQSRADDMIISAGYNISPVEVENALALHAAVQECAVVSWPDARRGQIAKAYVVLRDPALQTEALKHELQDFVKASIAPYKYPRALEFVATLPRTHTGKLQRSRLRIGAATAATSEEAPHPVPPGPDGDASAPYDPSLDRLDILMRLIADYGDAVRFPTVYGPIYLFNHPEQVRQVLQGGQCGRTTLLQRFMGNGLLVSEGDHWRRQRRLMQSEFRMARVETLAPAVTDATGRMLRRWSTTAPASIDIAEEMNHLICGIALRVLFHVELDEARQRKLTAAMVTVDRFLGSTFAAYLKPAPNLSPATLRNYREAIKVLDDFAYSIIADRSKQAERPDDLLSLLVSDADTGKNVQPLTTEQIRDEVITLLTAALLTTSSALSWAWILLGRHPVVEARFHQELDTVLAGRTPTAQDLLDLVYTRMVFDETLRLYPPVWAIERRAECEQNIGGYTVPADARVLISAYTTHRHPEFWPDPETFDPSRFAPDAVHERASFAYFPFAGGIHNCIGRHLAVLEAILVLATVGQVFRLLPLPDQPVVPDPMVTLQVRHGCLATVEARRSE